MSTLPSSASLLIRLADEVQVCVPAAVTQQQTAYVLLEQEDEYSELRLFLRQVVRPGMRVVDQDAGDGVDALCMARALGGEGMLVALNATSWFAESVRVNGFERWVVTDPAAAEEPADVVRLSPAATTLPPGNPLVYLTHPSQRQACVERGWTRYRLIPGLNALVAVDHDQAGEWACDAERAAALSACQCLIDVAAVPPEDALAALSAERWSTDLAQRPYAQGLMANWQIGALLESPYQRALNAYLAAQDSRHSLPERYGLLIQARDWLQTEGDAHLATSLALIRVHNDWGDRDAALAVTKTLVTALTGNTLAVRLDRPFIPPLAAFDERPVQSDLAQWLLATIYESFERLRADTSFHHPEKHIPLLAALQKNPNRSIAMERRLALCALRVGKPVKIAASSPLCRESEGHRNAAVWRQLGGLITPVSSEQMLEKMPEQASDSQDNILPTKKTVSKSEKQMLWKSIQTAQAKNDIEAYSQGLEKYLEISPSNIKALSMLVNYYWSIWLPETYQIQIINRSLNYLIKEHKLNSDLNVIVQKIQALSQRKKGVEIGKQKLAQYENIHRGERCVIIGNGPSLNKMDLSFLKSEYTFGMNRIYLGFEKFDFHPTYHICVNPSVLQQSGPEMLEKVKCPKFFHFEAIPVLKPEDEVIYLNCRKPLALFNTDPRHGTNFGSTVTYGALQLAYFMGFTEVILIGVDHHFETKGQPHKLIESQGDDPNHFDPTYFGKGYKWQLPDLKNSEMAYRTARKYYEDVGRRIIDATLDGKCQVFEKKNYQALFNIETAKPTAIWQNQKSYSDITSIPTQIEVPRDQHLSVDETKAIADSLVSLTKPGVMIDVGAFIGTTLIHFLNEGWQVLAFEPDATNRQQLEKNLAQHPIRCNLSIDPRAVSNQERRGAVFYQSPESRGISGLVPFHATHSEADKVDTVTLAKVLTEKNIDTVDFLKIDTEGHDLFVLQSFPWDRMQPQVIECEFEDAKTCVHEHPYTVHNLADFLLERGYKIYVSEWYPIVRYGVNHDWRRLVSYDKTLNLASGWGNLLAFSNSGRALNFFQHLAKQSNPSGHSVNVYAWPIKNKANLGSVLAVLQSSADGIQVAVDGGAGYGEVSKTLLAHLNPDGRLLAIEPFPQNLELFLDDVKGDPRVSLVQAALAANEGQQPFFTPMTVQSDSTWGRRGLVGYSSVGSIVSRDSFEQLKDRVAGNRSAGWAGWVDCVTLDSLMQHHGLEEIDFLKLDLQGGEFAALKGADHLLRQQKIKCIWAEVIQDLRPLSVLSDAGYILFDSDYVFPEQATLIPGFSDFFEECDRTVSSVETVYVFARRKFPWIDILQQWPTIQSRFNMIQTDILAVKADILKESFNID
jgi:FkbM family methyltransferase